MGPFDKRVFVESSIINREYFLDQQKMQRLKQLIWLGTFTGSFPWKWNSKTNQIERWGLFIEKLWRVQWFLVTIRTCVLTGFQLYAFSNAVKHSKTYRAALQSGFIFLWYSYNVILNLNT